MKTMLPLPMRAVRERIILVLVLGTAATVLPQSLPENAFVKIIDGAIVNDQAGTQGFGWADYDGDGDLDLLVANTDMSSRPQVQCSFYRNNGDGTFTSVTDSLPGTKPGSYGDVAWADYDNDGYVDAFVSNLDDEDNDLFRNQGNGQFADVTGAVGTPTADGGDSWAAAWIDYDRDGYLDLYVVNRGLDFTWQTGQNDWFYRNNGNGTFTKLTPGEIGILVQDASPSEFLACADYNHDGIPDLVRSRITPGPSSQTHFFQGTPAGPFISVTVGSVTRDIGYVPTWADYDNDGDLDLFFGGTFTPYALHRNLGGETFENVSISAGLDQANHLAVSCWGDIDNDGDLDIFALNQDETNIFYLNNGDGTFNSVDVGDPIWDGDRGVGVSWVDYDNDGFLDLFLACGNALPRVNDLYRNNLPNLGNSNRWLKVNLIGTVSNRSGIGAKVRVKANIRGQEVWQMREIVSTGSRAGAQQGLLAHFGVGDAIKVDTLRIEWPSGIVQELKNVAANQQLTVTEPPRLIPQSAGAFKIHCWINQVFDVQASGDLAAWSNVATVTNTTGTLVFEDAEADQRASRYYRVEAE
jgi:hypothetical protein